jgi:hypothetical protein
VASLESPTLVLDASEVVRIIEGSPEAAAFQQAVLDAERRAVALVDHIEPDRHLRWKHWLWPVIWITRYTTAFI